jgi:hypothetical protein
MRAFVVLLSLLLAACAGTPPPGAVDAPRVVAVAEWGGTPPDLAKGRRHTIERITLHHGGTTFGRDKDVRQHLKNLQAWSRRDKDWIDIPYHYLIDLDGGVYEGRPIAFAGDTNTEYDPAGHALIVVLGNYEEVEPNAAQLDAVVETMAMLARRFGVPPERIAAHRDYSAQTVCPGRHLYRFVTDGTLRERVRARLR